MLSIIFHQFINILIGIGICVLGFPLLLVSIAIMMTVLAIIGTWSAEISFKILEKLHIDIL